MKKLYLILIVFLPFFCQSQNYPNGQNQKPSKSNIYFAIDRSESMSTKSVRKEVGKILTIFCENMLVGDHNFKIGLTAFESPEEFFLTPTYSKDLFYKEVEKILKNSKKNLPEKNYIYLVLEQIEDNIVINWNNNQSLNEDETIPAYIVLITNEKNSIDINSHLLLKTLAVSPWIRVFTVYLPDKPDLESAKIVEIQSGTVSLYHENYFDLVADFSGKTKPN